MTIAHLSMAQLACIVFVAGSISTVAACGACAVMPLPNPAIVVRSPNAMPNSRSGFMLLNTRLAGGCRPTSENHCASGVIPTSGAA